MGSSSIDRRISLATAAQAIPDRGGDPLVEVQRISRTARGVSIPEAVAAQRHVVAHPIPNRGGNPHVHHRHLFTAEDHLAGEPPDELDSQNRKWNLLAYASFAALLLGLLGMIARSS